MSGKGRNKSDSILSEYLDDLLSVNEGASPWVEETSSGHSAATGVRDPAADAGVMTQRKRAGVRRPQNAVRLEDRPPPASLVSPAFRQIPSEAPSETEPESAPMPDTLPATIEPAPAEETRTAPKSPEVTSKPAEVREDTTSLAESSASKAEERIAPWRNGRPPWAQEGFECLIFRVAGLQLAVPLVLLGQIHRLDGELTPLVGRPDWFMGLLRLGEQTVRVSDTALWVMPDRYRREMREGYRFVIQLGDSAWGLACDEVAQSFRLQPDEVKWRSQGGRRQWLAGTIKKEMCALLDVARMADLLQKAETQRQPDLDR